MGFLVLYGLLFLVAMVFLALHCFGKMRPRHSSSSRLFYSLGQFGIGMSVAVGVVVFLSLGKRLWYCVDNCAEGWIVVLLFLVTIPVFVLCELFILCSADFEKKK
jgi:hypothetical protein